MRNLTTTNVDFVIEQAISVDYIDTTTPMKEKPVLSRLSYLKAAFSDQPELVKLLDFAMRGEGGVTLPLPKAS